MLKMFCVHNEGGKDIAAYLKTLQDKLEEIRQLAKDQEKLLEFVKSNRNIEVAPCSAPENG